MTIDELRTPNKVFVKTRTAPDGEAWIWNGLSIIRSVERKKDGKDWIHVSCARKNKMPTYKELQFIRREFIGEDRYSIMVFPPKDKYVNIHPFCLHLWSTDDMPVPEMSGFIGGLRSI